VRTSYGSGVEVLVKAIAFYLPQYHPIPENDQWWGKGFTEWTNVAKARPLFPGHYQPHIPGELGFYDLRLAETRQAQAELAREHGIHGFCYYHYWFNGQRILERPFNEVLTSGKPDFPFCLCWANENWTRRWDGQEDHVLLRQNYSEADDAAHIQSLIPAFQDERYIRIDGKPLFLVYRAEFLPNPQRTAEIWREAVARAGLPGLYLVRVLSYETFKANTDPRNIGFDADTNFAPFSWRMGGRKFRGAFLKRLASLGLFPRGLTENRIFDYRTMVQGMRHAAQPKWMRFDCVTPSWDNSPRRKGALIFHGSTPALYEEWLREVVARAVKNRQGDEGIVFINAWNEWAEGNHLEPDRRWGRAYLEATKRAVLQEKQEARAAVTMDRKDRRSGFRRLYWKLRHLVRNQIETLRYLGK